MDDDLSKQTEEIENDLSMQRTIDMDDGESQQHTERKLGLIHETEGDLNEKDVHLESPEKVMKGS